MPISQPLCRGFLAQVIASTLGGGEDGRRSDGQVVWYTGDPTGRGADAISTCKESPRGRFSPRATDLPVSPLMVYVREGSCTDHSRPFQEVLDLLQMILIYT